MSYVVVRAEGIAESNLYILPKGLTNQLGSSPNCVIGGLYDYVLRVLVILSSKGRAYPPQD